MTRSMKRIGCGWPRRSGWGLGLICSTNGALIPSDTSCTNGSKPQILRVSNLNRGPFAITHALAHAPLVSHSTSANSHEITFKARDIGYKRNPREQRSSISSAHHLPLREEHGRPNGHGERGTVMAQPTTSCPLRRWSLPPLDTVAPGCRWRWHESIYCLLAKFGLGHWGMVLSCYGPALGVRYSTYKHRIG